MVNFNTGRDRCILDLSMPDSFLRDLPEDLRSLSPDTRAIVQVLYAFERRAAERERTIHAETAAQINQLSQDQRDTSLAVTRIMAGFPGGDPESHCRYHDSIIEWRELRNRMVRDALSQASKAGALAAIGWIAYAIWVAFKMELHK